MSIYSDEYERMTGMPAPKQAEQLDRLFDEISQKHLLPPKGQQAADCGFVAHTFNDRKINPAIYAYYDWVLSNEFNVDEISELPANIIGHEFVCANIFATDWPQPVTVNPWQIKDILQMKVATGKAVIIENNGVFIWLLHRHPTWPLILQSGNDFNATYLKVMKALAGEIKLAYLGDLDTSGIRIADQLTTYLGNEGFQNLAVIQSPSQVAQWLADYGKAADSGRIHRGAELHNQSWKEESYLLMVNQQFVEQEQLIDSYETLIPEWLGQA